MADEKINALKKKRTVLRTSSTKFISKLEVELDKPETDENEIELLLEQLNDKFEALKLIDNELEIILKSDDLEKEIESAEEYREKFIACKFKVKKRLQNLTRSSKKNSSFVESSTINEGTNCNHREAISVKLPKITIPKFYGDISQWLTFWNSFETAIHNNEHLDQIDKFNYLKAHLSGTALNTIEGFSISVENYEKAIILLKDRFARRDILVNTHMNNLMHIPPLKSSTEANCFRKFFDNCQTQIRSLESLGILSETFSSLMCPLILKLLPHDLVFNFNKTFDSGEYTIEDLLEFLRKQLTALEKADTAARQRDSFSSRACDSSFPHRRLNVGHEKSYVHLRAEKNKHNVNTAADLFSSELKEKKIFMNCVFCNKHSDSNKCAYAKSLSYEEKKNILMKKGICFRCLKPAHLARSCRVSVICSICGQSNRHLSIMCTPRNNSLEDKKEMLEVTENKTLTNESCSEKVHLQTLIVGVSGGGLKGHLRSLIDTGSQNTYISKYAAKLLRLEKIGTEKIKHGLFGGSEMSESHNRYQLNLSSFDGNCNHKIEALDQKKICSSLPRIKEDKFINLLENRGIYISDIRQNENCCLYEDNPEEIHLLLGADTAAHLFTGRVEHFSGLEVAAFETKLGWTLMGKMEIEKNSLGSSLSVLSLSLHVSDAKLSDLWRLDTIGILQEENKTKKDLEEETRKHFSDTVKRESDGRYEVTLPWIVDNSVLSTNRTMAEKSLYKTEAKLINSNKRKEYEEIFNYWEANEIIETVCEQKKHRVHFLPHRPVIKESSETTKIRPVFNASAHSKNSPSLNDCLAKGPNLIEIIPRILNRFRKYRIGISSDIEKAFCQIKIAEKDRDFLSFFWFGADNKLKIYRHNRVVFGLTSSPFLLGATLNHLLNTVPDHFISTSEILKESFYIDNSLVSLNDVEEAGKFIYEAKEILASAHFNLRCWQSNIPLAMIDTKKKSNTIPVLGLKWDLEKDTFSCKLEETFKINEPFTKRKILSVTQKIFDPIGFSTPVTLVPKLILQETWIQKIKWDDQLPLSLDKQFQTWLRQLNLLSRIEIPRWLYIDNENEDSLTLHTFCDASERAYATCVYIRLETKTGTKVQLVNARSRIAPIKELTVPRLELLSCLIGARLAKTVMSDLKLENCTTVFWSDSSTALAWIRRNISWGTFVHNRVQEIRSLTKISDWRHVPGKMNPADLPSRGCTFEQLQKSKWWEGPSWLYLPNDEWPQAEEQPDEEILNKEKRKTILALVDKENRSNWYYRYFSSYRKTVRMIAWIFRFLYNLKNTAKNLSPVISVDEFEKAERILCKLVQRDSFNGIEDPKIRALRPIEDRNGIFRAKTKIILRDDKENFRYPIILPSDHPVTQKLVYEAHVENNHAGTSILMAHLRENFWLLKARKGIRNVIRKCIICKRFNTPRLDVEPGVPPEDRVREGAVFEVVGVDLAGPLHLVDGSKSWVVLYTCAIYRAIHLELVTSLTTETFIQAFRRFIARRGKPHVVYSDNGTNFVGANRALQRVNWNTISSTAALRKIRWKFNPPTASWWGGWWERLVRMVKEILRRILGRTSLNYEELNTVLCDCEQVINSRPITYVSEDNRDPLPLTPMMFLQELPSSGIPDIDSIDTKELNRRAKYRQRIRDELRHRFRSEYLGQLRQQALKKSKFQKLCVGDIVLIEDINKKRIHWPLARIIEILPGKDNIARLAKVRTENGTFLRPLPRLFPLEISAADSDSLRAKKDAQEQTIRPTKELNSTPPMVTRTGRMVRAPQRLDL